jgi:hypothetical protein
MKYRIINSSNDVRPYVVQRKNDKAFFSFWRKIESFIRIYEAENFVKRCAERHSKNKIGSILMEYDEADVIIDKIKKQMNSGDENVVTDAESDSF